MEEREEGSGGLTPKEEKAQAPRPAKQIQTAQGQGLFLMHHPARYKHRSPRVTVKGRNLTAVGVGEREAVKEI